MNLRSICAFTCGFALMLAAGWAAFPRLLYRTAAQPLEFNHAVHKTKGSMQCTDCHATRADGSFAGVPATQNCATCHAEPMGTTPAEKILVASFVKPGREIPWKVYSRQPVNVTFSHSIHVTLGKVKCEECHGNQGTLERLPSYGEDRISGYSSNIRKMSDCERCHEQHHVEAGCLGCHQ